MGQHFISAALPVTTGPFYFYLFFILNTYLALSVFIHIMTILITAASQGGYAPSDAQTLCGSQKVLSEEKAAASLLRGKMS